MATMPEVQGTLAEESWIFPRSAQAWPLDLGIVVPCVLRGAQPQETHTTCKCTGRCRQRKEAGATIAPASSQHWPARNLPCWPVSFYRRLTHPQIHTSSPKLGCTWVGGNTHRPRTDRFALHNSLTAFPAPRGARLCTHPAIELKLAHGAQYFSLTHSFLLLSSCRKCGIDRRPINKAMSKDREGTHAVFADAARPPAHRP